MRFWNSSEREFVDRSSFVVSSLLSFPETGRDGGMVVRSFARSLVRSFDLLDFSPHFSSEGWGQRGSLFFDRDLSSLFGIDYSFIIIHH